MVRTGPAGLAITWSQVKLAKEMARTDTISNQQASPIALAKSTASGPKAMRYRNGLMRIYLVCLAHSPTPCARARDWAGAAMA